MYINNIHSVFLQFPQNRFFTLQYYFFTLRLFFNFYNGYNIFFNLNNAKKLEYLKEIVFFRMHKSIKLVTFDVFNTLIKTKSSVGFMYAKEADNFLKAKGNTLVGYEENKKNGNLEFDSHLLEKEFHEAIKHFRSL